MVTNHVAIGVYETDGDGEINGVQCIYYTTKKQVDIYQSHSMFWEDVSATTCNDVQSREQSDRF